MLSGAPYGYRYVKKNDVSAAYYQVVEAKLRWCAVCLRCTPNNSSAPSPSLGN